MAYLNHRNTAGYTLIEVLVAVLITALGVVGMAAAHLSALKFNQTAEVRSQATLLAYDIADRMRANRRAALSGDYDTALPDTSPSSPSAVHETDLKEWLDALTGRLPSGDGAIARNGTTFTITVQWDESRVGKSRLANADGTHTQTFAFVTEL